MNLTASLDIICEDDEPVIGCDGHRWEGPTMNKLMI